MTDTAGSVSQAEEIGVDTSSPTFVAEFERMDLSKLYDQQFIVAVNKGDRNKGLFLCNTIKGPYDFAGMVQAVSNMHKEHMHHAKVIICNTEANTRVKFLDAGTIDYIEANTTDILFDATIGNAIINPTCVAGVVEHEEDSTPPESKE